jgi:asparagine synthase (glutamine-hydrolysing)
MCGIAGILHVEPATAVVSTDVERMIAVLQHRGPDAGAVYVDGAVGLGHRRLSIIDVAGGQQPMLNEDGTKAIIFNGEIYNYAILRERLVARGYRFATRSDTEVILHAYEEYGEGCVQHLRGMFAFAIWDAKQSRLFLARDRLGIKPLYYRWDGHTLLFGSELKAILQYPAVSRQINPLALDDYLTYLYIPSPKTIFRGIQKLRPGHTLMVSRESVQEHEYWDVNFALRDNLSEDEYAAGLFDTLQESVSMHLMSEVPLGAFLSGGVDSSAVVGLMARALEKPINTASIGFQEMGFDELPYARMVSRHFGTQAYERIMEAKAAQILDLLVWHFDEPFADASMVPTYYVSQVARERVTVCLSGDGGDENFAGYRRYRFDAMENRMRRLLPGGLRHPLFGALAWLYPKADWLPQVFRAKSLLTNLSLSPERAYFQSMSWFSPAMKRQLYGTALRRGIEGYDAFSAMQPYFDRTHGWDPLSRIQYVDIKTYLVDDILTKVDRASMAHSLEVRVPLLDHEVVEFAASIPGDYKLRRGEGKYILKRALEGLLPHDILYRRKMGFSLPLAQWFRGELKRSFEERVLTKEAFVGELFDQAPIRQWWIQHQRGTRDYAHHLWALLVLECWGERFLV